MKAFGWQSTIVIDPKGSSWQAMTRRLGPAARTLPTERFRPSKGLPAGRQPLRCSTYLDVLPGELGGATDRTACALAAASSITVKPPPVR